MKAVYNWSRRHPLTASHKIRFLIQNTNSFSTHARVSLCMLLSLESIYICSYHIAWTSGFPCSASSICSLPYGGGLGSTSQQQLMNRFAITPTKDTSRRIRLITAHPLKCESKDKDHSLAKITIQPTQLSAENKEAITYFINVRNKLCSILPIFCWLGILSQLEVVPSGLTSDWWARLTWLGCVNTHTSMLRSVLINQRLVLAHLAAFVRQNMDDFQIH